LHGKGKAVPVHVMTVYRGVEE